MKAVFVSDVSPRRVGVFGMRVAMLAEAMARRGHHVVVLFPAHSDEEERTDPRGLVAALGSHDWQRPFNVTYHPRPTWTTGAVHESRLPAMLRRPLTAGLLMATGGVHGHYVTAARPFIELLATQFRPDVVWGNFGNSSNLVIAQMLARRAGVPWVMDLKDSWEAFLHPWMRGAVARRFRDAAGFTSNAEHHEAIGRRWHRQPSAVIYSSVEPTMIASLDARPDRSSFVLSLIGAVHHPHDLGRFLGALRRWLARLDTGERARVAFHYAGNGWGDVERVVGEEPLGCSTTIERTIPHARLAELCHRAAANCYLWAGDVTFHHKLLELMVCRRPAIVFPGEHGESLRLVQRIGGELIICWDEPGLEAAFSAMFERWQSDAEPASKVDPTVISWDRGAEQLDCFLRSTLGANKA